MQTSQEGFMNSFTELKVPAIVTNGTNALIVIPAEGPFPIGMTMEFMSKPAGRNILRIWTEQGHLNTEDSERLGRLIDLMALPDDGDAELLQLTDLTARVFFYAEGSLTDYTRYVNKMCEKYSKPCFGVGELLQIWTHVTATSGEGLYILINPDGTGFDGMDSLPNQLPERPCILFDGSRALFFIPCPSDAGESGWRVTVEFDNIPLGMTLIQRQIGSNGFSIEDAGRLMEVVSLMPLAEEPGAAVLTALTVRVLESFGADVEVLVQAFSSEKQPAETFRTLWDNCVNDVLTIKVIDTPEDAQRLKRESSEAGEESTGEDPTPAPESTPLVDTSDPLAIAALWGAVDE